MDSKFVIYKAPEGAPKSEKYSVQVNSHDVHVYDARIDDPDNCAYTYFDFQGIVHVKVTVPGGFQSVKVRPLSTGIVPVVDGNTFEFDMQIPRKLCIELNESIDYPFFMFPNTIEDNRPEPGAPGVRYFEPGIHDAGEINIHSNETVYVAGGAIVKGYFTASDAENIKILGRGIMDAHGNNTTMIRMTNCKNVVVEGIIVADQPQRRWTTSYWSCDDVLVKNFKILAGDYFSNDGIDIVSCHGFTVDDCFVKCYDDCVVIKALRTNRRTVKDIKVINCLLWNIQAYAVQIGPELDTTEVSDILVKNCDIIHPQHTEINPDDDAYFYCAALGILNGDDSVVSNVRYEDIRIEDVTAKLISLKIMKTQWNHTWDYGKIKNIYFKDIQVIDGKTAPSEILSYGFERYEPLKRFPDSMIENVTFENLKILGKTILNAQDGGFIINPCSVNLKFIERAEI